VAAINGDYYRDEGAYAGDPKGLQIMRVNLSAGLAAGRFDRPRGQSPNDECTRFEGVLPTGQKFLDPPMKGLETPQCLHRRCRASTRTRKGQDLILQQDGTNSASAGRRHSRE
jgi:hypothetical protein